MNVQIRRACPEDAETAGRIASISWRAAYRGIIPDDFLAGITSASRAQRFTAAMSNMPDVEFYITTVEGVPAGVMNLHGCLDEGAMDRGEIGAFYFMPEYWGKGCAAEAMRFALHRLRERGFPAASLWVLEDNLRARRFYEKQGFTLDGDRKTVNIGKELWEVRYRIDLY